MTTTERTPDVDDRQQTVLPIPAAQFPYLWFSGEQVPWEQALVHVTTIGLPAIGAIFEGIRGYWNEQQQALYIFRLPEHMARFDSSVKLQRMTPRHAGAGIGEAIVELCRSNAVREDVYIQPMAFTLGTIWGSRAALDQANEI